MPDLKLKDDHIDAFLVEIEEDKRNKNPDKKAYKSIEELELGEANLKFSMRRKVAAFLTLCAALIMITYVLHLILPYSLHWLSPCQLNDIKDVAVTVFGGLALSIGTLFFSKK